MMDIGTLDFSMTKITAFSTTGPLFNNGTLDISCSDLLILSSTSGDTYITWNSTQLEIYVYGQLKLYLPISETSGDDVYLLQDGNDLSVYGPSGKVFSWTNGAKMIFDKELKILDKNDNLLFYI